MSDTKYRLLNCLKQATGQWASGQQISRRLGISRAAIWKHIQTLKDEGHVIDSAPRKGYRLAKTADILLAEEVRARLRTRVIGRPDVICLAQTDSTNQEAKRLAAKGAPEGTVVVADSQTSGRGRRGRSWFSPAGRNLYLSILLRPSMSPAQTPRLTLMAAVAAAQTLNRTAGLSVHIKWPNDILIGDKKVVGILTEISTEMDAVDYVVVGLGINVNTPAADMPPDIRTIATSIRMACGARFSRTTLLCSLLQHFETCYDTLKRDGFKPIMALWRDMSDIIGQPVHVDMLNIRHTGIVEDVDDDGVLILKDDAGRRHRIFSGDVTRIRKT